MATAKRVCNRAFHACQVLSCTNTTHSCTFLRFLPGNERYKEWLKAMNPMHLAPFSGTHIYVCSKHFSQPKEIESPGQSIESSKPFSQKNADFGKQRDKLKKQNSYEYRDLDEDHEPVTVEIPRSKINHEDADSSTESYSSEEDQPHEPLAVKVPRTKRIQKVENHQNPQHEPLVVRVPRTKVKREDEDSCSDEDYGPITVTIPRSKIERNHEDFPLRRKMYDTYLRTNIRKILM